MFVYKIVEQLFFVDCLMVDFEANFCQSHVIYWNMSEPHLKQYQPPHIPCCPHQCKAANYCSHTVHDIFDHGGLAIAYNNATDPVQVWLLLK